MLLGNEDLVVSIDLKVIVRLIKVNTGAIIKIKITAVSIILFTLFRALFQTLCLLSLGIS
jgi:hypothetical protein